MNSRSLEEEREVEESVDLYQSVDEAVDPTISQEIVKVEPDWLV